MRNITADLLKNKTTISIVILILRNKRLEENLYENKFK